MQKGVAMNTEGDYPEAQPDSLTGLSRKDSRRMRLESSAQTATSQSENAAIALMRVCPSCRKGLHAFNHSELGCLEVVWVKGARGAAKTRDDYVCACVVPGETVEKRRGYSHNKLVTG